MCNRLTCSILLALSATLAGCATAPADTRPAVAATAVAQDESARLNAWFDEQYEQSLQFSPMRMTMLGRKDLQDQLEDASEAATRARLEWMRRSVAQMEAQFDYQRLDEDTRLSWQLWKRQYERARDGEAFRDHGYPFTQFGGTHSFLPTFLINFHKVEAEADYLAYISRLRAVPVLVEQTLERARASSAKDIRAPRFAFDGVIDQARRVITGAPFTEGDDSALWADAQAKADALVEKGVIDAARGAALKQQAREALEQQLRPAYDAIIAYAEGERGKAPTNPSGVGTTHPGGEAFYNWQIAQHTTTDMSAEQIHQLGLSEVARLRGEMEALKQQVGFDGDLQAFFRFIATDPQFKYPDTDAGRQAYIDDATAAIDTIRKVLPQYFGLLPKAELVVRRVEPFREQPGAAQHYYPGTPDGSRPGIYYAHLSDMNAMPKPELEVIAYHEGLPGHHMQISIAQELTGVPKFRTQMGSTAYSEGWGLYSEWLAKEMPGTYQDPYSEYGRLTSEMWRAIRLVVDTGMHAKGWTEEQAVAYFLANSSIPETAVRSEVQRYLVMPGQATAYKVGMIRIQQLRARAESELGDRFDIRGFHDTVLGGGAMPLDLLEQRVERWIAARKAG
ncbi:MAG: DUF885 domain-containing protein [Pseudoxanthomonas suwonensis]|nr:DUF885 domain-containing protein [Pseudoxanthomonas suwonensis]